MVDHHRIDDVVWHELISEFAPESALTPLPEFRCPRSIRESHRLPLDYQSFLRGAGHGRIEEKHIRLYAGPQLGREVIPDAHRHGLEGVVVIGEDDAGNFIVYNNRFETWYLCFVVGEMRLVSVPKKNLTFTTFIEDLLGFAPDSKPPLDHINWQRWGKLLQRYAIFMIVPLVVLIFLMYYWFSQQASGG